MTTNSIPYLPYQLFFRHVEPVVTLIASCLAGMPSLYLSQLKYIFSASSAPTDASHKSYALTTEIAISLYQLANIYLLFALLGYALLKPSTNASKRAWKTYLACFLLADVGHVMTLFPLAEKEDGESLGLKGLVGAFKRIGEWNVAGWGMIGYLAVVIVLRTAFILDIGVSKIGTRSSHGGQGAKDISTSRTTTTTMSTSTTPWPYTLFFLYIEPLSALTGAIYAALPSTYLSTLTPLKLAFNPPSLLQSLSTINVNYTPSTSLPSEVTVSLYQLSNMYLMFALIEFFVLRTSPPSSSSSSSGNRNNGVWRAVLGSFLIADLGHLATMYPLGTDVFWKVNEWNAMAWGSVGWVYVGAGLRTAYLLGVGLGEGRKDGKDE